MTQKQIVFLVRAWLFKYLLSIPREKRIVVSLARDHEVLQFSFVA